MFHFQNHELLIGIFFVLFAGWALLGWYVGEAQNLIWLRRWCGPIFVIAVAMISVTVGVFLGRGFTKARIDADVTGLLNQMDRHLRAGRVSAVLDELQSLQVDGDGALDDLGTLKKLPAMTSRLKEHEVNIARGTSRNRM